MSYSDGIDITYDLAAVDFTGAAATDNAVAIGPKGLTGRVKAITCLVTTGITVAASTVDVGIVGGDLDAYASAAMAITAANGVIGGTDLTGGITDGVSGNRLPADTKFAISNGGGSTAGVGNVQVVVEWS
jgi:hypothetical protein